MGIALTQTLTLADEPSLREGHMHGARLTTVSRSSSLVALGPPLEPAPLGVRCLQPNLSQTSDSEASAAGNSLQDSDQIDHGDANGSGSAETPPEPPQGAVSEPAATSGPVTSAPDNHHDVWAFSREQQWYDRFVFVKNQLEALVHKYLRLRDSQSRPVYSPFMVGTSPSDARPSVVVTCRDVDFKNIRSLFHSRAEEPLCLGKPSTLSQLRSSFGQRPGKTATSIPRLLLVYYRTRHGTSPVDRPALEKPLLAYLGNDGISCGGIIRYGHRSATLGITLDLGDQRLGVLTVDHLFWSKETPASPRTIPSFDSLETSSRPMSVEGDGVSLSDFLEDDDDEYGDLDADYRSPSPESVSPATPIYESQDMEALGSTIALAGSVQSTDAFRTFAATFTGSLEAFKKQKSYNDGTIQGRMQDLAYHPLPDARIPFYEVRAADATAVFEDAFGVQQAQQIGVSHETRQWDRLASSAQLTQPAAYLDWALAWPASTASNISLALVNTVFPGGRGDGTEGVALEAVQKHPTAHLAAVYIVSGIRGIIHGEILGCPSFLPSFEGESCEAWTVVLDPAYNGIFSGECGSIVVDTATNKVYGHVVGSNPFGHAYVVSLATVMEQTAGCFGGKIAPAIAVCDAALAGRKALYSRQQGLKVAAHELGQDVSFTGPGQLRASTCSPESDDTGEERPQVPSGTTAPNFEKLGGSIATYDALVEENQPRQGVAASEPPRKRESRDESRDWLSDDSQTHPVAQAIADTKRLKACRRDQKPTDSSRNQPLQSEDSYYIPSEPSVEEHGQPYRGNPGPDSTPKTVLASRAGGSGLDDLPFKASGSPTEPPPLATEQDDGSDYYYTPSYPTFQEMSAPKLPDFLHNPVDASYRELSPKAKAYSYSSYDLYHEGWGGREVPRAFTQPSVEAAVNEDALPEAALDGTGYVVEPPTRFQPGTVLKMIWCEPLGGGLPEREADTIHARIEHQGIMFYQGLRRFIVIGNDEGFCTCVPIMTYERQGCLKRGVKPLKHGIVYQVGKKPRMLPNEPHLGFEPVRVNMFDRREQLVKESRVNYAKLTTIEHNFRVCIIGAVDPDDFSNIVTPAVDYCWQRKMRNNR